MPDDSRNLRQETPVKCTFRESRPYRSLMPNCKLIHHFQQIWNILDYCRFLFCGPPLSPLWDFTQHLKLFIDPFREATVTEAEESLVRNNFISRFHPVSFIFSVCTNVSPKIGQQHVLRFITNWFQFLWAFLQSKNDYNYLCNALLCNLHGNG